VGGRPLVGEEVGKGLVCHRLVTLQGQEIKTRHIRRINSALSDI
jgi:hypothetical protein